MARAIIRLTEAADLPPFCVCCGAPATGVRRQEFRLDAALSAAVLVTAALLNALAWTERGLTLALPVCAYHRRRGRQSNRTFFRGMALVVALGVAAYLGSQFDGTVGSYLGVAAMFAFMAVVWVGMHQADDGLAVKSLKGDSLTLSGVSREFAEAVERRGIGCRAVGS
jgi:hypothetical protein